REAHEDGVENTTSLTGGDHVHVQITERVRVLRECVGHRVSGLDVEHDGARDLGQDLVLGLLRENVERLYEWQTGVDHRRELPSEDADVPHLDGAAGLRLLRGLLVDLDDAHALAPELRDDLFARRRVDRRGLELAVYRPRGVCECRHGLPVRYLGSSGGNWE